MRESCYSFSFVGFALHESGNLLGIVWECLPLAWYPVRMDTFRRQHLEIFNYLQMI
jgi:hypothetical protein